MNKILNQLNNQIMLYNNINDVVFSKSPRKVDHDHVQQIGFNYLEAIKEPTKNNSIQTKQDLEEIIYVTQKRDSSDIYLVYTVDREPLDLFQEFASKKDIALPRDKFKYYYNTYMDDIVTNTKNYYNRPRPKQLAQYLEKDIDVIETSTHDSPAYPSGHAVYAYFAAHLFSDQYSRYKRDFFKIADTCAYARILQGVHYREDNIAAKKLVSKIYRNIINLDNQRKLNDAKISQVIK